MKKSTKLTIAAVLSLGIIGATGAYAAKDRSGDHTKHAERAVTYISNKLDLDTTQEQALSVLKDQVLVAKEAMHGEMGSARDDFKTLLEAESFDQGKALELINNKTATVNSVAPELVVAFGNFMDSLNAEQKEDVLEFMNSRGHRGKKGLWRR